MKDRNNREPNKSGYPYLFHNMYVMTSVWCPQNYSQRLGLVDVERKTKGRGESTPEVHYDAIELLVAV